VLRIRRERPGCSIIGYADDTLILCADNLLEVQSNINAHIKLVMRKIEFLSLEVAPEKTEAVLFWGRRRADPTALSLCALKTLRYGSNLL